MSHKSFAELAEMLKIAEKQVKVGGKYEHYRTPGKHYTVHGLVLLEATDEVAVRYSHDEASEVEWVRPLSSWLDTVTLEGNSVPRFKLLNEM